MKKDMTQGNIYLSLLFFTLPVLCSNLLQQLYNVLDSIIVGRVCGDLALAAVGAAYQISTILVTISMGLTIGMSILISRSFGQKELQCQVQRQADKDTIKSRTTQGGNELENETEKEIQIMVDSGMFLVLLAGLVLGGAGVLGTRYLLELFHVPQSLMSLTEEYLRVLFLGTIPVFIYNAVTNDLRGIGDSTTALFFLISSVVMDLLLDIVFVWMLHWGVMGAAWATVIAQLLSSIGLVRYVNNRNRIFRVHLVLLQVDRKIIAEGLQIGIPATLQQLFLGIGNIVIQYLINGFGPVIIAAYAAASKIDGFAMLPAVNTGQCISNYIAQNIGAGNQMRVKKGVRAALVMTTGFSIVLMLCIHLGAGTFMHLFAVGEEALKQGARFLKIQSSFYILFSIMHVLNGVLIGEGRAKMSLAGSILSFCALQVPVAVILSAVMGVIGIWVAAPIGWFGGMLLRIVFIRQTYLQRRDGLSNGGRN